MWERTENASSYDRDIESSARGPIPRARLVTDDPAEGEIGDESALDHAKNKGAKKEPSCIEVTQKEPCSSRIVRRPLRQWNRAAAESCSGDVVQQRY